MGHIMVDNQISDLTRMFIIKDSWLASQDRRQRSRDNFIKFLTQRVLVIAIFAGMAAVVHSQNDQYSAFVYGACCTLYILVKK